MIRDAPLLRAENLTKRFGRLLALSDMNLELFSGEVVGLVGQNGAGKSTLLKLLSGVMAPDSGRMLVHGVQARLSSVADANRRGIGMVFQEQALVPNLTVAENILLGVRSAATAGGVYRWKRLHAEADIQLAKVGARFPASAVVGDLLFADRQSVELAKVLTLEERVKRPLAILLDEPTTVLTGREIENLFAQIERLKTRAGIIFVSHRIEEVIAICDRVYVLRDGVSVAERSREQIDEGELYRLMVGDSMEEDYYAKRSRPSTLGGSTRLTVRGLSHRSDFSGIDFDLARGAVLGIAGVVGSGRETLCRTIYGAEPLEAGTVAIDGKPVAVKSPAHAVELGIGYVPADRRKEGLVVGRSVAENLLLPSLRFTSRAGVLVRRRSGVRTAAHLVQMLHIKTPSIHVNVERLSGGNQQKCVLAKWLALPHLRVLILDHPTRGLDVRAKGDLYELVRDGARRGLAIVLLSDTLEELVGLSDQLIVMRDGRITGEYSNVSISPPRAEDLIKAMV